MRLPQSIVFSIVLLCVSSFFTTEANDQTPSSPDARPYSAEGDAKRGKIIFMRCNACHNGTDSKTTRTGPNLNNIFGKKAGTAANYDEYSKALKTSGIVWDEEHLNAWLQNPTGFLPGNKMSFTGVRLQKDRNDLMAYLRSLETQ